MMTMMITSCQTQHLKTGMQQFHYSSPLTSSTAFVTICVASAYLQHRGGREQWV